jgi:ribonuclease HII
MDEAGRGAVLGPLIVAGALVSQSQGEKLWSLGARDSKAVARPRRKAILKKLWREGVRGKAVVIPPEKIETQSLTALELSAMAELIRKLGPDEVVLDPPVGPRALPKFLRDLAQAAGFPREKMRAFPKADQNDPVVAAASLLAKVVRDGYVSVLRRTYGDFGWGYPGEGKVQEFLRAWVKKNGDLPPICRRRWHTVSHFLESELHFSR